jgi:chaperonin GroEL
MKMKTYLGTDSTKNTIANAIRDLAGIVAVTLGPGGRPILLEVENRPPLPTKDGVTVARFFQGKGDLDHVVARAAIEICERTVRDAGDGTTTAIVLGSALVQAGQKYLDFHPETSPQALTRELKKIFQERVKPMVLDMVRNIRDLPAAEASAALKHVALISANGDEEIAKAVAEAVEYVGENGVCIAEEGAGMDCRVEYQDGFSFSSGLSDLGGAASAAFVNRQDYGDCVIDGSYVVMYDGEINDVSTVVPVLQRVESEIGPDGHQLKSPVVIFAHRFSDQVLKMMAHNFRRGTLTVVPVVTPRNGQANGRSQYLHDLASYVGGTVFDAQGAPLPEAHLSQLGVAESFKYGRNEGVILGQPDQTRVEKRIADLEKQMIGASEFDCDLIRYRIGRLNGGIATIYAGGKTSLEAKERHARVTDAICAVRSAMQMGVVPGGGAALAVVSHYLDALSFEERGPADIFIEALRAPFQQIMENAGLKVDPSTLGHSVTSEFVVFDALKGQYVEWWSGGIMDPAKVTLSALENALSVAQLLMTLGGAIVVERTEGEQQVRAMQEGLLKAIEGENMA